MKRQIMKSLAALCAGVMTLCAASFFTSCDKFDDTQLKEEIAGLKTELGTLDSRLKAVEALKTQLDALSARVDALYTLQFQVTTSNELQYSFDGGKTWTGTKIILAKEPNVSFRVSVTNELEYTVDGKTYKGTGIVLAKDCEKDFKFRVGTGNKLEISTDGGKTYVATDVVLSEECSNEFEFRVTEDKKVEFSFDGGTTWVETGATVVDPCTNPKVSYKDNGATVTITIGEESFDVEKPEEIVFEIKAGKLLFAAEDTKEVTIKSQGIDDISLLAVPKGWSAEMSDNGKLVITAPNQSELPTTEWDEDLYENVTIPGTATESGYVKLHACSVEGKCIVGRLLVEVSEYPFSVEAYGGKYFITPATNVYMGVSTVDTYKEDAGVLMGYINNAMMSEEAMESLMDWPHVADDEGMGTIDASGDLKDILGEDLVAGEEYVVWALQVNLMDIYMNGLQVTEEDFVLAYYSQPGVEVTEGEKSAYDIDINVNVVGADKYVLLTDPLIDWTLDELKELVVPFLGQLIEPSAYSMMSTNAVHSKPYSGSVRLVDGPQGPWILPTEPLTPGQEVAVLVVPIDGRPTDQYTSDDIVAYTYKVNDLTAGGTVNPAVEQITAKVSESATVPLDEYTELGVEVTPSAQGWKYWYSAWVDEETAGLTEEEIIEEVYASLENYKNPLDAMMVANSATFKGTAFKEDMGDGETAYFVTFFVDENDKYGEFYIDDYTTKTLSFNSIELAATPNLTGTDALVLMNEQTLTVELTPATPIAKYKYVSLAQTNGNYRKYDNKDAGEIAKALFFEEVLSLYGVYEAEWESGATKATITVPNLSYGTKYFFALIAYDENGNPSGEPVVYKYECKFEISEDDLVVLTGDNAPGNAPTVSLETLMDKATVEAPANTNAWYDVTSYMSADNIPVRVYQADINLYYSVSNVPEGSVVYSTLSYKEAGNMKNGVVWDNLTAVEKATYVYTQTFPVWNLKGDSHAPSETPTRVKWERTYEIVGETVDVPEYVLMYVWKSGNTFYYGEIDVQSWLSEYNDELLAKKTALVGSEAANGDE